MKNTKHMKKFGSEKTHLELSEQAARIYAETDPFEIFEEETEDGFLYSVRGCLGDYDDRTPYDIECLLDWFDEEAV